MLRILIRFKKGMKGKKHKVKREGFKRFKGKNSSREGNSRNLGQ